MALGRLLDQGLRRYIFDLKLSKAGISVFLSMNYRLEDKRFRLTWYFPYA
jgi:hypothetical protein